MSGQVRSILLYFFSKKKKKKKKKKKSGRREVRNCIEKQESQL